MTSKTMLRARLLAELNGTPFLTRKQRREREQQEARERDRREREQRERERFQRVADYVKRDDASRRRAIRLSAGSAYGIDHKPVAFRSK